MAIFTRKTKTNKQTNEQKNRIKNNQRNKYGYISK